MVGPTHQRAGSHHLVWSTDSTHPPVTGDGILDHTGQTMDKLTQAHIAFVNTSTATQSNIELRVNLRANRAEQLLSRDLLQVLRLKFSMKEFQ